MSKNEKNQLYLIQINWSFSYFLWTKGRGERAKNFFEYHKTQNTWSDE